MDSWDFPGLGIRFMDAPAERERDGRAISYPCMAFLKAMVARSNRWGEAFENLNRLSMYEMLRALAALDPEDLRELGEMRFGWSDKVNMPRIDYAFEVVSERHLPETVPGELRETGQVGDAQSFLTRPTPLFFDTDLTGHLPRPNPAASRLTDADFQDAARNLGIEVAAIQAVADVEAGGRHGFAGDGRPILRYELHIFHARTGGKYYRTHPHLSQPSLRDGAPYHRGGQDNEWSMLYGVMLLRSGDDAAWSSASWGMFQVMGFNHT
jgi:hypothetical protein